MFQKNLDILKRLGYDETYVDGNEFEVEKTKDGLEAIKIKNEKKAIYSNSLYNTHREVQMLLESLDFDRDNLFIVYGLGMGYHIREIFDKMTKFSYIFVIESNKDILTTYMRNCDFSELINKNTLFFFGSEEEIINKIYTIMGHINTLGAAVNSVEVIPAAYKQIYGLNSIYDMNSNIIESIKHSLFLVGNDIQDSIDGFENYIKNIKDLIKSPKLNSLKDKYIDKPAIIVSAGPSLDKNIHLLKEAQGKALILATDAVISSLEKYNVIPDAVFSVERVLKTYEAFYKDKQLNEKTVFVGPSVIRPEILETLVNNKKILFLKQGEGQSGWINANILKEDRLLTTGASCAHTALSFAKYLGADPIIFVGQDLAFTQEGITHSKDVEIKQKASIEANKLWVKGINGEKLPTNLAFKNFLLWFETEIAKDKSERKYIDATEGGAYKKGTIIMKFKEVLEKYCNEEIVNLYEIVPNESELDEQYINTVYILAELKREIISLMRKCKKQNRRLSRYLKSNAGKDNIDSIDKGINLLKLNFKVERAVFDNKLFLGLFQSVITAAVIAVRKLGTVITDDIVRENMAIQIRLNKNILLGCKVMLRLVSKLNKSIIEDEEYKELIHTIGGREHE
ncbi:motility associated factor glycosyltransferase family protein [Clostridium sp. 'White wine YQ']|uniref:motility associated factor glycosyltransferase family protein n=1 Tax=Clostridium sp. 'White wine YQ' TaxID=3027474 RepID=UPI002365CA73|nr:6-hydroxymethylpterin diphosphokinase MptE-like protein [Clostridium sp. 'White wine YQ']MDD7794623.1 DUF115 domain-containing protein [Clostridium sp. 'White wine YQ']